MAQTFSKILKNRAVCNYWGGSRKIDTFGQQVTVDSSSSMGKVGNTEEANIVKPSFKRLEL